MLVSETEKIREHDEIFPIFNSVEGLKATIVNRAKAFGLLKLGRQYLIFLFSYKLKI